MFRSTFYLAIIALLLVACKKGDELPALVRVATVDLDTDPTIEFTDQHAIIRTWAFINDDALGIWEVPSTIPILRTGNSTLKLIAGIRRNGNASEYVQYPFYNTYSTDLPLSTGGQITINPTFEYFTGVSFWNEGFEDPGIAFLIPAESDTSFWRTNDPSEIIEGTAALIHLTPDADFFRAVTDQDFNIRSNQPVYLEINYRSDHRFLVGTYANFGGTVVQTPYIYVAPSDDGNGNMPWKKIYIDLSTELAVPGLSDKEIYIEAQLEGASSPRIWLDNIKMVFYEP